VTDRNKDRVADEVKDFAPSLTFGDQRRLRRSARILPVSPRLAPARPVGYGRGRRNRDRA
jgi:hypothetical protein